MKRRFDLSFASSFSSSSCCPSTVAACSAFSRVALRVAFSSGWSALLLLLLLATSTRKAQAQVEWEDWPRYDALDQSLAALKKSDPQAAVEKYRAFWKSHPQMHPISGCSTFAALAQVQRDQLKQPEAALKSYDEGLQVYADSPAVVILLGGKAQTLRAMKRNAEAGALGAEWWPKIRDAARSGHRHLTLMASISLYQIVSALEAQVPGAADKSAERGEPGERDEQAGLVLKAAEATSHPARKAWVDLLQKAITECPLYLDDRRQGPDAVWFFGWMYRHLMIGLITEGRADEALGWGRLYWSLCAFDEGALKDASRLLGRAWTSAGKTKDVLAFVRAQSKTADSATQATNPLIRVKLPALSGEAREYSQARWLQKVQALAQMTQSGVATASIATNEAEDAETINLGLLQALTTSTAKERNEALELAMMVAEAGFKSRLQAQLDDKNVGREVARVFKAADGDTVRAQAFLAYLEGKGANPLPGFYRQVRGGVPATATSATSAQTTKTKPAAKPVGVRP